MVSLKAINKPTLFTFIFLVLAWGLLIAAYTSTLDIGQELNLQVEEYNGTVQPMRELTLRMANFKASLAFAIIAWIVDTFLLVFIALCLVNLFKSVSVPIGIPIRAALVISVALCIISVAVFAKVPSSRMKDCQNALSNSHYDCIGPFFHQLIGSDSILKVAPAAGWPCVIFALLFTVISAILSFFSKFQIKE
eukprot:gene1499-1743_t